MVYSLGMGPKGLCLAEVGHHKDRKVHVMLSSLMYLIYRLQGILLIFSFGL